VAVRSVEALETPKGVQGKENGEGGPPPQPISGSGERRKLPQRVLEPSPGRKRVFGTFWETHLVRSILVFFDIFNLVNATIQINQTPDLIEFVNFRYFVLIFHKINLVCRLHTIAYRRGNNKKCRYDVYTASKISAGTPYIGQYWQKLNPVLAWCKCIS